MPRTRAGALAVIALALLSGCAAPNPSPLVRDLSEHLGATVQIDRWSQYWVFDGEWKLEGDVSKTIPEAVARIEAWISSQGKIVQRLGSGKGAEERFDASSGLPLKIYYMYAVEGRGDQNLLSLRLRAFPEAQRLEASITGVELR